MADFRPNIVGIGALGQVIEFFNGAATDLPDQTIRRSEE